MMKPVSVFPLGQVHSLGDFLSAYYVSDTDLALRIRGEQDRTSGLVLVEGTWVMTRRLVDSVLLLATWDTPGEPV